MLIFVQSLEGGCYSFNVEPSTTLCQLKEEMLQKINNFDGVWFSFAGKPIDMISKDGKKITLSDLNIQENSTIHMLAKLIGG
jgi:hypothetical protein